MPDAVRRDLWGQTDPGARPVAADQPRVSEADERLQGVRRFVTLDLETVADEALVSAVDGEPSRPYPEQLRRVLAERRARTGGRSDFLPLPYHRPVAACSLEAVEEGGAVHVVDVASWTDRRGDEPGFLAGTWDRLSGASLVTFHGKGFDLPVLELRSLKHAVPIPGRHAGGAPEHLDLKDLLTHDGAATRPGSSPGPGIGSPARRS